MYAVQYIQKMPKAIFCYWSTVLRRSWVHIKCGSFGIGMYYLYMYLLILGNYFYQKIPRIFLDSTYFGRGVTDNTTSKYFTFTLCLWSFDEIIKYLLGHSRIPFRDWITSQPLFKLPLNLKWILCKSLLLKRISHSKIKRIVNANYFYTDSA